MVELIKNSNSKGPGSAIIGKYNHSSITDFYSKNYEDENDPNKKTSLNTIKENTSSNEINFIGKGGFSRVYVDKLEIKVAKKKINKENEIYFKNEIKYLDSLNKSEVRNNVVHLYNYLYDPNENKYIINLELCDGDLIDFRNKITQKNNKKFPLNLIQNIMNQINKVMWYLIKEKRLCYNDMKPENILYKTIDETKDLYEFKLCDFNLVDETISKNDISKNKKGTDYYMGKDKRNTYVDDVRVYDKELNEIRDLANVMYFLYFGEVYNDSDKNYSDNKIKKIEDNDFYYLLKNTLATSSDFDRMSVDEYFKNYFFL